MLPGGPGLPGGLKILGLEPMVAWEEPMVGWESSRCNSGGATMGVIESASAARPEVQARLMCSLLSQWSDRRTFDHPS